ncbi:MAG: hypothetical protein M3O34_14310 [Chloroflexota bacterium]|nr:hypothetical protein [Chloroflexota bacterium]
MSVPQSDQGTSARWPALASLPVAHFALCEILRVDTPANHDRARRFLEPLRKIREPMACEAFAGKKDYSAVHPLVRWVMVHVLKSPEGGWRDWDAIRAWADGLAPRLTGAAPALTPNG